MTAAREPSSRLPAVGVLLVVEEEDYLYGEGRILLIVRAVSSVLEYDGVPWVSLRADQVLPGAMLSRYVQVRVGALRAAKAAGRRLKRPLL